MFVGENGRGMERDGGQKHEGRGGILKNVSLCATSAIWEYALKGPTLWEAVSRPFGRREAVSRRFGTSSSPMSPH